MPKKSKREKLLADTRRSNIEGARPVTVTTVDSQLSIIKKDLFKTILLATMAITAEFILFFIERR